MNENVFFSLPDIPFICQVVYKLNMNNKYPFSFSSCFPFIIAQAFQRRRTSILEPPHRGFRKSFAATPIAEEDEASGAQSPSDPYSRSRQSMASWAAQRSSSQMQQPKTSIDNSDLGMTGGETYR